jgi:hypothetical protein
MNRCSGPCAQGHAPCPTPEACQVEIEDLDDGPFLRAIDGAAASILGLLVFLLVVGGFGVWLDHIIVAACVVTILKETHNRVWGPESHPGKEET